MNANELLIEDLNKVINDYSGQFSQAEFVLFSHILSLIADQEKRLKQLEQKGEGDGK